MSSKASGPRGKKVVLALLPAMLGVVVVLAMASFDDLAAAIRFAWRFERLARNAQGCLEYRHRQTGMVLVKVPGGAFLMGSPEEEEDRRDDELQHQVTLSPFLIAKHEVTQAQWRQVMGTDPSRFKGDDLPIENVSWEDCQDFCKKTALALPSEAQWEYVCRAGTAGPFAGELDALGWYDGNGQERTHPVGEKQPNGFGIHDMHGNVWEWCEDWHLDDFYRESAGYTDPLCENPGSEFRVARGGAWFGDARDCRSACRARLRPSVRGLVLGLRPSRSLP
jgi:formylglycine-generating enzyme required for sulfatase activity